MKRDADQRFSSRWLLLLAVLGIAVGTGNIWRFPRIAAQQGGDDGAGAFILVWLLFLVVWSIPLIIAEYALGQHGRLGVVGSFVRAAGARFAWMGAFVGWVATAIMFYYAVVAGWCVFYFGKSLFAPLPTELSEAQATWDGLQGTAWPLALLAVAVLLAGAACWRGVQSIERASRILVPTLLVIVVIAVVRALTLPGAWEGVAYLFTPDWSDLTRSDLYVQALTQNAWDTGAGWGLILTYAAYMKREHGVVRNAVLTGVGNNTVSLLAGTMVFGTVFAVLGTTAGMETPAVLAIMRDSGPAATGLTFIWMPQLFAQMPLGRLLSVLFFLGLSFAALSSLISMVELTTRSLVDFGMRRKRAVLLTCAVGFVLGAPSALDTSILENQDYVWGVALMVSGAFVAFAVLKYGASRLRAFVATPGDWPLPRVWLLAMTVLVPLQAIGLLGWWLWQIAAAGNAADPFTANTLANFLLQWGLALGALLVLNRFMVRRLGPALDRPPTDPSAPPPGASEGPPPPIATTP